MSNENLIALLAEAQNAEVMQTSIGESEDNLQVDWDSRSIVIPPTVTNAGVINDHLSKKLVIEMDRYVGGNDIAAHTFAIHFYNVKKWEGADKEYKEFASGVYPVTSIDTSVEGKVICEWDITNASTQIVGVLVFALHVFTIVDGSFTYHLGVQPAVLDMLNSINATDHSKNVVPAELEVWLQKMRDLNADMEAKIAKVDKAAQGLETAAARAAQAQEYMEQAKMYSENAAAVTGVGIATEDRAGLMKGGENAVDEDGTLVLTRKLSGSAIVADGSHAGGLKFNKIYGKSVQETIPGNQLFSGEYSKTYRGVDISVIDSVVTMKGTVNSENSEYRVHTSIGIDLSPGTYTVSCDNEDFTVSLTVTDSEGTLIYDLKTYTVTGTEQKVSVRIVLGSSAQPEGTVVDATTKIMLNTSDTALPWEPYCGGVASPNPEYPQDIVSAGDSGSVVVKTNGANLCNPNAFSQPNYYTVDEEGDINFANDTSGKYHPVLSLKLPKGDYTVTLEIESVTGGAVIYMNSKAGNYSKWYTTSVTKTYTDTDCIWFCIAGHNGESMRVRIMINAGTTAVPWKPYTEQILTFSTPNGLPGIEVTDASLANYTDADGKMWCCDEIDVERGVYVQRCRYAEFPISAFTKKVFTNTIRYNVGTGSTYAGAGKNAIGSYCNVMLSSKYSFNTYDQHHWYIDTGFNLYFPLEYETEVDALKYISVCYILATPIETPLTDEEIISAHSMKTYDGVTHIFTDGGDVDPTVEVEYGTSKVGAYTLESLNIAKRNEVNINALQNAIISMGGNV